jgi:small-conductance mechanosensitive channel
MRRAFLPLLALAVALFASGQPAAAPPAGSLAQERALAVRESLVGSWVATVGKVELTLEFAPDGTYRSWRGQGVYAFDGERLELGPADGEGEVRRYSIELRPGQIVLSGGDLAAPLTYVRNVAGDGSLRAYAKWLFEFSPEETKRRTIRILTIIAIVIVAVVLVQLLRVVSGFLIFSQWGPLRFIYTRHKTKTRTVHSVVLNLVKYFVYFTALGQVLAELGVNYTAYFASLSVIGLAIGFGSQGLVQDIVTGFFLIFDGQFGVGDLVEISGQTGIVEELGLRTTRLRNYQGQMVVIPNRNIAVVGNFTRGALQAQIDFPVDETRAADAERTLRTCGTEFFRQLEGTLLREPQVLGALRLQTGEVYVRWLCDLWPQQQALVDNQLIPRAREQLAKLGLEIPRERIVVLYRRPEPSELAGWRLPFGPAARRRAKDSD